MNLVGKIFVFLIMVMSICFSMLAVGVYMAQTNWREKVLLTKEDQAKPGNAGKELGLKYQLENAKKQTAELGSEKDDLEKQYKTHLATKQQRIIVLESEKTVLAAQHQEALKKNGELLVIQEGKLAEVQAAQEKLNSLRKQVEDLKEEVKVARDTINKEFEQVVVQTEKNHQLLNQLRQQKERNEQLTTRLATAVAVLERHDIKIDEPVNPEVPPVIDGVVTGVRVVDRDIYVQLSVGSDDGLMIGHTLEIFRGSTYLGKVNVIRTEPDKAVGRVEGAKGQVQVRDKVESRRSLRLTAG